MPRLRISALAAGTPSLNTMAPLSRLYFKNGPRDGRSGVTDCGAERKGFCSSAVVRVMLRYGECDESSFTPKFTEVTLVLKGKQVVKRYKNGHG